MTMYLHRSLIFGALLMAAGQAFSVHQAEETCTVDSTGFVGADGGTATSIAFEYALNVLSGDTAEDLASATAMLPALEITMAEALSATIFEACGAILLQEGGSMSNIIGFNTKPVDEIVTSQTGTLKECSSGTEDCYVVHSAWTVYVNMSSTGVATDMLFHLANVLAGGNASVVAGAIDGVMYPNFVSINPILQDAPSSPSPSAVPSTSPSSAPPAIPSTIPSSAPLVDPPTKNPSSVQVEDSPTKSPTGKTGFLGLFDIAAHANNVNEYHDENTLIFYGLIFAAGIGSVFCCFCFCKLCCGEDKRRRRRRRRRSKRRSKKQRRRRDVRHDSDESSDFV